MDLKDLILEDNNNSPLQKIEVEKGLILSRAFAEHWPEITSTKLDYIKIEAIPSTNILRTQSFLDTILSYLKGLIIL